MFSMPGINWYTDTFDSFRVVDSVEGGITKHTRTQILSGCPCRVYQNPTNTPTMTETASQAADSGALLGIVSSASLGDASVSYDTSSATQATQNWGQWNLTTYGQQYASLARVFVIGGSYVI